MNQINLSKWEEVQETLRGQMTRATYDAHIAKTTLINYNGRCLTLLAAHERSAAIIKLQLKSKIQLAAASVYENDDVTVQVTAGDWEPERQPAGEHVPLPSKPKAKPKQASKPQPLEQSTPIGSGFTSLKSNFTATPNGFFDQLLADPDVSSVTIRFVAAVIRHTLGVIDTKGNRREWWEDLTIPDICKAAGIKSSNSAKKARLEAVNKGWVKFRPSTIRPGQALDLAIRYEWEEPQHVDANPSFFD